MMGLLQNAYDTYEANRALAGKRQEGKPVLCPVGHIVQKAQLTVELDGQGGFVNASKVDKEDTDTIIPATEKSASRTSGSEAHPLCDQLGYLCCWDEEKHEKYLAGLRAWVRSEYTHPMLMPILRYVEAGTLAQDIGRALGVEIEREGKPAEGKINGVDYPKCLVRWRVSGHSSWETASLFDAFQGYYASIMSGKRGLCMLSGGEDVIALSHDKGIIPAINSAKLVSANDGSGFTYRGRFMEAEQACTVGYTASQKAHKALRWVAEDQGVNMGGRTFICWNPQGHPVVQPTGIMALLGKKIEVIKEPTDYYRELKEALLGFRNGLPRDENVVIAAFDAATTGRMALTYYSELTRSAFLERVEAWYASCCWQNGKFGVQSPNLLATAHLAYGTQRENRVEADNRVVKEAVQRLFRCIVEGAPVPRDIVNAVVQNASQPQRYDASSQWKLLFTACALVRKYRNDMALKEEWTMALEPEKKDRSYQFGRLLALMEQAERATYLKGEERETNAMKLRSRFCMQPLATAVRLDQALAPYFRKMKPGLERYYKDQISSVMAQLSSFPDDEMNDPLEDTYLMGYYLQRTANYKNNETEEEDNGN